MNFQEILDSYPYLEDLLEDVPRLDPDLPDSRTTIQRWRELGPNERLPYVGQLLTWRWNLRRRRPSPIHDLPRRFVVAQADTILTAPSTLSCLPEGMEQAPGEIATMRTSWLEQRYAVPCGIERTANGTEAINLLREGKVQAAIAGHELAVAHSMEGASGRPLRRVCTIASAPLGVLSRRAVYRPQDLLELRTIGYPKHSAVLSLLFKQIPTGGRLWTRIDSQAVLEPNQQSVFPSEGEWECRVGGRVVRLVPVESDLRRNVDSDPNAEVQIDVVSRNIAVRLTETDRTSRTYLDAVITWDSQLRAIRRQLRLHGHEKKRGVKNSTTDHGIEPIKANLFVKFGPVLGTLRQDLVVADPMWSGVCSDETSPSRKARRWNPRWVSQTSWTAWAALRYVRCLGDSCDSLLQRQIPLSRLRNGFGGQLRIEDDSELDRIEFRCRDWDAETLLRLAEVATWQPWNGIPYPEDDANG